MKYIQGKFDNIKESYPARIILPLIEPEDGEINKKIMIDDDMIKVSSLRLLTFKTTGLKCVKCGIAGSFFRKEKSNSAISYHLNLYAIDMDGNEILMTKDHIVPLSKGGKDDLTNLQTMCIRCNVGKGNNEYIDYRGGKPKSLLPLYDRFLIKHRLLFDKIRLYVDRLFTIKKTKEQHLDLWNNKNTIRRLIYRTFGL